MRPTAQVRYAALDAFVTGAAFRALRARHTSGLGCALCGDAWVPVCATAVATVGPESSQRTNGSLAHSGSDGASNNTPVAPRSTPLLACGCCSYRCTSGDFSSAYHHSLKQGHGLSHGASSCLG